MTKNINRGVTASDPQAYRQSSNLEIHCLIDLACGDIS